MFKLIGTVKNKFNLNYLPYNHQNLENIDFQFSGNAYEKNI